MTEEFYFETSFRFKWGVGFIIEMLEESLASLTISEDVFYALEGQVYQYDLKKHHFEDVEKTISESTETNFVLKMSKDLFERVLEKTGFSNDNLKKQLITEFNEETKSKEEKKRLHLLHETYDEMNFFDAVLSYTALSANFLDDDTMIIDDPQPQKQNKDFQMI